MVDRPALARAYLGLGGNIGDSRKAIADALEGLGRRGARVVARSADYRTPPWGKTDQPAYVNACAIVETALSPHALLEACLAVERDLGRVRREKWGPRAIDIDVLAYEERVIATPDLIVPHPYMLERAFVLAPLAEIAPDLSVGGTSIADHLSRFDTAEIERLPPLPG
ncbi:MAG TPA: 2-amino-4-hydroxy-6-hydroxymethyldihydropteridine diphosphokinase [Methylomirabilota bacterium]|nr:2-amino-4-hydroxy-6-hydroxymethyldihydropteridine diphosphokinase [Methylomirabilota bacterium]